MSSPLRSLGFPVLFLLLLVLGGINNKGRASRSLVAHAETLEACEPGSSWLITWNPAEIECPICQTKNIFMVWGSYGNYIYQYPEKYQLVFWPNTDSPTWYSCKKCRFSAFMEDFKNPPKEKIADLQKMLEGVTLPAQKVRTVEQSMEHPPYLEIPVSDRLLVVEKVNHLLGQTSDDYWNHFYRVLAYHFDSEKKQAEADEARRKALAITERLLADKADEGRRKELLYISGAMRHFLRDDATALKDFEEAKKLKYSHKDLKEEQNKNYDDYLAKLISDYIEMLHKGKGPRDQHPNRAH